MMHTSVKPVQQQEIQISCFSDPGGVSPALVPGFTVLFMFRVFVGFTFLILPAYLSILQLGPLHDL